MNIAIDANFFVAYHGNKTAMLSFSIFIQSIKKHLFKGDKLYLSFYHGAIVDAFFFDKDVERFDIYLGPGFCGVDDDRRLFTCDELSNIGVASFNYALTANDIDIFFTFGVDNNILNLIKSLKSNGRVRSKFVLVSGYEFLARYESVVGEIFLASIKSYDISLFDSIIALSGEDYENLRINNTDYNDRVFLTPISFDELTVISRKVFHSAQNFASQMIKIIYEKIYPHGVSGLKNNDKKYNVAMLSPMPPEQTGIADYAAERLPFWRKYFNVDVFTNPDNLKNNALSCNNIYPYSLFEEMVKKYDYIIYQMGNSPFHLDILDYLQRYPGIVIMHDCNIQGLFRHLFHNGNVSVKEMTEIYFTQYGQDFLHKKNQFILDNCDSLQINKLVTSSATGVIVHSNFAKQSLSTYNINLPICVAPHSAIQDNCSIKAEVKKTLMQKYGLNDGDFIIGIFGNVSIDKRIFPIMDLFAEYIAKLSDKYRYKLVIVGTYSEIASNYLNELNQNYDLDKNIIVTGWTSHDDFCNLMYVVDGAFNLRYPTKGETSGTLARLMKIGKPVAVTNVDAFAEIPDECCIKVRYGANEKNDILNALRLFIENSDKIELISKNAKQYMEDECSLDANASGYYKMLQKLELLKEKSTLVIDGSLLVKIKDVYSKYSSDKNRSTESFNDELVNISELLFRLQRGS